jgi:hypothetical protein
LNERGLSTEHRAAFFAQKAGALQLQDRFLRLDRQDLDRQLVFFSFGQPIFAEAEREIFICQT